jgi:hypothetical protein
LALAAKNYDHDIRDANGKRWLHIDDGWFDLRLETITDVIFTPRTKNIFARRDDSAYISLRYKKYSLSEFRAWVPTFMTNREIAESANVSIEKSGAVDTDGNVPVVIIEGCFRTRKVSVDIKGDNMFFESHIPGLRESFYWHSWVVDDTRRAIMKIRDGAEFFSLG